MNVATFIKDVDFQRRLQLFIYIKEIKVLTINHFYSHVNINDIICSIFLKKKENFAG